MIYDYMYTEYSRSLVFIYVQIKKYLPVGSHKRIKKNSESIINDDEHQSTNAISEYVLCFEIHLVIYSIEHLKDTLV
jgi:hypothetical protein